MGKVVVPIVLSAPTASSRSERLEALVDAGATLSMMPAPVLRRLRIRPTDRIAVQLADGRIAHRSVGEAKLKLNGQTVTSRVMFGKPHDATVVGLVVLESLGLTVDPSKGEITKGEMLLLGVRADA